MKAIHVSANNFKKFDISKVEKHCLGLYFRTYNTEEELLAAKITLLRKNNIRYLYYVDISDSGLVNSWDKLSAEHWKTLCSNAGILTEGIDKVYTNIRCNLDGNFSTGLLGYVYLCLVNKGKSSKQIFDIFTKSSINGVVYNVPKDGFPGQVQVFNPDIIKISQVNDITKNTFSISNLTLKRYLIKLLRYNQSDSDSYNKIKSRIDDPFVMSLIGDQKFESLKGIERENYLNKLMADVRYLGNDTLKHISYVARNLRYEEKLEDTMNKKELFSELRKVCADSKNPNSRKLFNELVKSFNCPMCDSTPGGGGASLSMSGVMEQGAKVEDKLDDQLDERLEKHSTFAEDKIKSLADFKDWLHNFMENVHGSNYNKQVTEKVADDLNKKYNSDFGAMIGAAKSFLHMKDEE